MDEMIVAVAYPGFGGRGSVNYHRQGRNPCPRHEVPSGGWDRESPPPSPGGNKMEIRKCLDEF